MAKACLAVRAEVPEAEVPASTIGTRPITCLGRCGPSARGGLWRCWSRSDPAVHVAFYELNSVEAAKAATAPEKIQPLVADFDRVWGDRVPRRRAIMEVVQEIMP